MDVFLDFKEFVTVVRATLPQTNIVYITSNPDPSRWKQADKEKELSVLIANFCRANPGVACLDTFDMVLGPDGKPRPELLWGPPAFQRPRLSIACGARAALFDKAGRKTA
jgi:hypothetical protein